MKNRQALRAFACSTPTVLAVTVAALISTPLVQAAVILQPQSATAGSVAGGQYTAVRSVDKSGLSASYTSGVSNFATTVTTLTHSVDAVNTGWASKLNPVLTTVPTAASDAALMLDMGSAVAVSRIGIWVGLDGPGGFGFDSTDQFEVFSSADATYTTLVSLGTFNLPDDSPGTGLIFDITNTTSRYFLLNVISLHTELPAGNDHASFGEVAFEAVPEPSVALLGGLGLFALLRRRR